MFIELTDQYGFKVLVNMAKVETVYSTADGSQLAFSPESGHILVKESYTEVKSTVEYVRQQQK